jgi:DNA helicase HerA-like ATPase
LKTIYWTDHEYERCNVMIRNLNGLAVAKCEKSKLSIHPKMANRHGLIAGATGTGKTVTLQVLSEAFSEIGVPVFMADVKGDLSGMSAKGEQKSFIDKRLVELQIENFSYKPKPVRFWDVFGKKGHPVRTTISEMGPLLLSRLMDLNETQSGVLNIIFRVADDNNMLLLDLKDLRAMVNYAGEHASDFTNKYGNVSSTSIGAIQRALLSLEDQEADKFFGEPELDINDFMQCDTDGKGIINILAADTLYLTPKLYSTFLLWLLAELFEELPEVGDMEKPKMIFFFDEAHLIFDEAPKVLLEKIEQVVRLIRSKGIGIYFITQNPTDIPDDVLGQLGNRIQHALRAFTPRDQKAVKSAAETFRPNPELNVQEVITQLGVGDALVSFLDEKGIPSIVESAKIYPPESRIGPVTAEQRNEIIKNSPFFGRYEKAVDRESAYEILSGKHAAKEEKDKPQVKDTAPVKKKPRVSKKAKQDIVEGIGEMIGYTIGGRSGRKIVRGILGSLFKG